MICLFEIILTCGRVFVVFTVSEVKWKTLGQKFTLIKYLYFFYFSSADLNGIWIFLDLSMNFMQFYRFRADRGPRHQNCTFTNEK